PPRRRPERARRRRQGAGSRPPTAGDLLGVQRRPGEPPEPVAPPALPAPAGRGAPARGDGPDRRGGPMAVGALPQLLRRARRRADAVGAGRLPLGRRPLDLEPGPGALRVAGPPRRALAGPRGAGGVVDRGDASAVPAQPPVRPALVAQHRACPLPERAP